MTPQCFNIIGLLFDMVGVIILFFFGLSQIVTLDGTCLVAAPPNTPEEGEKNKKEGRLHLNMSRIGLLLILIGFALQMASNLIANGENSLAQDCKREMYSPRRESPLSTEPAPKS